MNKKEALQKPELKKKLIKTIQQAKWNPLWEKDNKKTANVSLISMRMEKPIKEH